MRGTERLLSLSVLAIAALFGCAQVVMWLVEGRHEQALPIAVALGALLVGLLGVGLLMHVPPFELALASLAWSFCASIVTELSPFAAARHIGSGPAHVPVYLALALLTGAFALGLPRGRWWPADPASRAAALLALWSTLGGRLFERDGETALPLLAGAVLLVLGTRSRFRLRDLPAGLLLPSVVAALVAWWAVATWFGDSWRLGVTALSNVVVGAALAWALASSLDRDGARAVFAGLVFGVGVTLVLLLAAVAEMLQFNEPIRVFGSRLSLFARHPNQVAPVFVVGACLLAPLALGPRAGGQASDQAARDAARDLPRWLALLALAACLAALAWTQSRGGILAGVAGLAVAVCATRGWLPRRPARSWGLALTALLALVVAFASPLGDGLRARLAAETFSQSAVGQRYHLWRSASAAVADHPLVGLGPAQYYAHARYALPSYYDGTYQDVHPHSLFFAAAESAGLPGLVLVIGLLVGLLELGRRRVLELGPGIERCRRAGLLAACAGLIAANAVDFQGGTSLMPLLFWIALGVFAAQGRPPGTPERRAPAVGALATWACLLPLCAMPLAGALAVDYARRQPDWTAARIYELLHWAHPWNSAAVAEELSARVRMGQRREALELARREALGSPERLGAQVRYGLMLLEAGRVDEAAALLERAQELDPLGSRAGMTAMALARVHAARGDVAAFRGQFLRGLTLPEGELLAVPHEVLPPEPGDPEGSRRVAYRVGGPEGRLLSASQLLDQLGERALKMIEADEVNARRLLGRVVEGYLAMGLSNEALVQIERYTERAPEMFSMTAKRIDLLCRQGDHERAAQVFAACPDRHHPYMTVYYLRGIEDSDDPELQRQFRELPIVFKATRDSDLYFTAEQSAPVFEAQAERALVLGQLDEALVSLERALYHYSATSSRLQAAEHFFERAARLDLGDGDLLRVLAVLLREANQHRAVTHDAARMDAWAQVLRKTWDGPVEPLDMPFELELVLRRAGPAGRALGAGWSRTDPSAEPDQQPRAGASPGPAGESGTGSE